MGFHSPDIPFDTPLDSRELENFLVYTDEETRQPSGFLELDGQIRYLGQSYLPNVYPVYAPGDSDYPGADIPISGGSTIYRCAATGFRWVRPSRYVQITIKDPKDQLDEIFFHWDETAITWTRYAATEDPLAEDPSGQQFIANPEGNALIIIGVHSYCERLHIPAAIDGSPVDAVYLSESNLFQNLRELVVEEGVRKLYLDFALPRLTEIQLPDSVELVAPPNGICKTRWFHDQGDGPVYFHNYYCGTKGTAGGELAIRPGTIGVVKDADQNVRWTRISFPKSLRYLGENSFNESNHIKKLDTPGLTYQLRDGLRRFPGTAPFYVPEELLETCCWDQEPVLRTGEDLYRLARFSPAARAAVMRGLEPLPPRLRYEGGWLADFWYCTEDGRETGCRITFRLPQGVPAQIKTWDIHPRRQGIWTDEFTPSFYHFGEAYLERCVRRMALGKPSKVELEELTTDWYGCIPDVFKRWKAFHTDPVSHEKPLFPTSPMPTDRSLLCSWTWQRVKDALLRRAGITEEEILRGGTYETT